MFNDSSKNQRKGSFEGGSNADKSKMPRWASILIFLVVLIGGWQISAMLVGASYILPTPVEVLVRAGELVVTADFWASVGMSVLRIFAGFALGMIIGIILAIIMHSMPRVRSVFAPFIKIIRTTPIVCFILLALLWVSNALIPTFMVALMVMPVAWTNTIEGLDAASERYRDVICAYRITLSTALLKIYMPAISVQLLSAAGVGMGLAWKSGVTAEVLSLPAFAIGTNVYQAKMVLDAPDIFVWTIAIILISLVLEYVIRRISDNVSSERASDTAPATAGANYGVDGPSDGQVSA